MIQVQAASLCEQAGAYLDYALVPTGPVATTTKITFVNPTGDDVVVEDQPLVGRTPWPGIVRNAHGKIIDWPGWHRDHGVWVKGDEFDWAVEAVSVEFEAGPIADAVIAYPNPSPNCVPLPQGGVGAGNGAPDGSTSPDEIDPPETSTLPDAPVPTPAPFGLLIVLFAATLAAAAGDINRRRSARERTDQVPCCQEAT